jgi:hypothetical protein
MCREGARDGKSFENRSKSCRPSHNPPFRLVLQAEEKKPKVSVFSGKGAKLGKK